MPKRILVVTTESLPPFDRPCAGGGVRAHALGEALRAQGHRVAYALPDDVLTAGQARDGLELHPFRFWTMTETILKAQPDLVLFEQWYPLSYLEPVDIPVVVDLPGPLLLENHYRGIGDPAGNALVKLRALAKADYFLHATAPQQAYWMAWLLAAGVNPDHQRLLHVPVQLCPRQPTPRPVRDEPMLVHAGVFWAWQDPAAGLTPALAAMDECGRGHCTIIGGRHPSHHVEGERYAVLPPEFAGSARVSLCEPLPFGDLVEKLAGCSLAIDTSPVNAERRLSSNIRSVVYLWCGLPVVVSDHSYLAGLVERYEAGWVVPGAGGEALHHAVRTALEQPDELARRALGAQRLAKEHCTWDGTPHDWLEVVQAPTKREGSPPLMAASLSKIEALEREQEQLRLENARLDQARHETLEQLLDAQHALGAIQGRLLFRLENRLRRLLGKSTDVPPRDA